jgi:hypothetical protein
MTMTRYTTSRGRERDDFIEAVANIRTSNEERWKNEVTLDAVVLDSLIRNARRLTTASEPIGELLQKDENISPAFRKALKALAGNRTEEVG